MNREKKNHITLGNLDITFYGGVGEIGGNIIYIKYKDTHLVLDAGLSFNKYRNFYEWPHRQPHGAQEMIRLGITPDIRGLYVNWLDSKNNISEETEIKALYISHAHVDHIGLLTQINRNIDIYLGETAKLIEDTRKEIGKTQPYSSYKDLKLNVFRTGETNKIDDFIITPIHVDHSIPGAYAFILETPEGNILYTGDYRLHGEIYDRESLTLDMVNESISKDIDLMITEGTRFHDTSLNSERDVYETFKKLFFKFRGAILITFSYVDIDRWESILKATKEAERKIIIPERQFIFLWRLYKEDPKINKKLNLDNDDIKVLVKNKVGKSIRKYREIWVNEGYELTDKLEKITAKKYLLSGFTDYIHDILDVKFKDNAIAIFSNSEPINEEGLFAQERILNWLNIVGIPSYRIHCSGHVHPLDLKKIVNEINPKYLYIIHSEHPEALSNFLGYEYTSMKKMK